MYYTILSLCQHGEIGNTVEQIVLSLHLHKFTGYSHTSRILCHSRRRVLFLYRFNTMILVYILA